MNVCVYIPFGKRDVSKNNSNIVTENAIANCNQCRIVIQKGVTDLEIELLSGLPRQHFHLEKKMVMALQV